jgi:hypothetical protein
MQAKNVYPACGQSERHTRWSPPMTKCPPKPSRAQANAYRAIDTFVADGRNTDLLFCLFRTVMTHEDIAHP